MAKIIGDHIGSTFDDFLVLPGLPEDTLSPESVNLRSEICGIKLGLPFFTAAMRSITGKEMALAAGKAGMMAVAPRGLSIEKQAEIVRYVKENEIKPGKMESITDPVILFDNEKLGDATKKAREYGHSNMPVVTKKMNLVGMFVYTPSKHDRMNADIAITKVMESFKDESSNRALDVFTENMDIEEMRRIFDEKKHRIIPVIDDMERLSKVVFMQKEESYKVGAAIDTHPGWEERTKALTDAGVDMIFIDTSDALKSFAIELVKKYKELFPNGPPICAGNVVTSEAFDYLVEADADAIKVGMGPGSICTTNQVLGIGAPPLWALIEICNRRDEYAQSNGKYVPVIVDGGIENTGNMTVAMTHADGLMGGKLFGSFDESAGEKIKRNGNIVGVKIYGEASREAFETTGDMKRYSLPIGSDSIASFQGISGLVSYKGKFKPGLETFTKTLREALFHAGCKNLKEYRKRAVLIRLSERAKQIAKPHGVQVVGE
ncbi:MAG: IMP dehydrogenase [Nanoarchaeota archaeon]|nr:IMP dehydrogenase [Nanoarchaeota archaeon]MBU1134959.1 IMP dehydrogenase [Nanoarchaeota archaeon]MBU2519966.1 IMP dehydrogenase [Nanoarchaeota archaeon]